MRWIPNQFVVTAFHGDRTPWNTMPLRPEENPGQQWHSKTQRKTTRASLLIGHKAAITAFPFAPESLAENSVCRSLSLSSKGFHFSSGSD